MARAIQHWSEAPTLWQPCSSFEGYAWYDRLQTITPLTYRVTTDGETISIEPGNSGGLSERPDRLEVVLGYEGAASPLVTISTDLLLVGSDDPSLDKAEISLTRSATITPCELVSFLEAALLSPSDDSEAGSYATNSCNGSPTRPRTGPSPCCNPPKLPTLTSFAGSFGVRSAGACPRRPT